MSSSSTVADTNNNSQGGHPKGKIDSTRTNAIRGSITVHLSMMCVIFYLNLENIDSILSEMGLQMRKTYLSCCVVAIVYFICHQVLQKKASGKRKEANVYRTNMQVFSVYQIEEGEVKGEWQRGTTESTKKSMIGKKRDDFKVYMENDGAEGEFNRAQRSIYNWQESKDQQILHLVLCSVLLQYFMIIYAFTTGFGYIIFSRGYTQATVKRYSGVVLVITSRISVFILLCLLSVKTALYLW